MISCQEVTLKMCEGVKSYISVDCAKDNSDLLQIQIFFFLNDATLITS